MLKSRRKDPKSADFETLVRPHLDALYRTAYQYTGTQHDAEDLVQDLLVKLYPRRKELAAVDKLRPWLARVMFHIFIDNKRRYKRSPVHLAVDNGADATTDDPVDLIPNEDADPETATNRDMTVALLLKAIDRLSEDHRLVLTLHDVEGFTLEEMQTMLDCPIGTLKSRLHRARARLRELLETSRSLGNPFAEETAGSSAAPYRSPLSVLAKA